MTFSIALVCRIHYKTMCSVCNTRALKHNPKERNFLIRTNVRKANVAIPKNIKWDQINLPNK